MKEHGVGILAKSLGSESYCNKLQVEIYISVFNKNPPKTILRMKKILQNLVVFRILLGKQIRILLGNHPSLTCQSMATLGQAAKLPFWKRQPLMWYSLK